MLKTIMALGVVSFTEAHSGPPSCRRINACPRGQACGDLIAASPRGGWMRVRRGHCYKERFCNVIKPGALSFIKCKGVSSSFRHLEDEVMEEMIDFLI